MCSVKKPHGTTSQSSIIRNIVSKEYSLEFPRPRWIQQNPEDWRRAVPESIPELLAGFDAVQVAGIGRPAAVSSVEFFPL